MTTAPQKLNGAGDKLNGLYIQLKNEKQRIGDINWNVGQHTGYGIKSILTELLVISNSIQTVDQSSALSAILLQVDKRCREAKTYIDKAHDSDNYRLNNLGDEGELRQKIGEVLAYANTIELSLRIDHKQFRAVAIDELAILLHT